MIIVLTILLLIVFGVVFGFGFPFLSAGFLRVHELLMQLSLPARIAVVLLCCLFVPPLILPFSIWAIVLWDKRRRNV